MRTPRRKRRIAVATAVAISSLQMLVACCVPQHAATRQEVRGRNSPVSLAFGDSMLLEGPTEFQIYRVVVRVGSTTDTLPVVFVSDLPVVVRDSVLLGFSYSATTDDTLEGLFSYDLARRRLEHLPEPPGFNGALMGSSFSPDGHYLAYTRYVGRDSAENALAAGVIREWPGGALVLETPHSSFAAGDVSAGYARWLDARRYEFLICLPAYLSGTEPQYYPGEAPRVRRTHWVRFRGRLGHELVVDTLSY
jgi:hypothetical protein